MKKSHRFILPHMKRVVTAFNSVKHKACIASGNRNHMAFIESFSNVASSRFYVEDFKKHFMNFI